MKQIEFTITREDFQNSSRIFVDPTHCPLATAVRRVLNRDDVLVGTDELYTMDNGNYTLVGRIAPHFLARDFQNLARGIEFQAKMFLYEPEDVPTETMEV